MREEEAWDSILLESLPEGAARYFEMIAAKISAEIRRAGAVEVAEFGCGRGELIGILARGLPDRHFIGYDCAPAAVSRLRERALPNQEFDNIRLPRVPVRRFDCVICLNTLHYVPDSLLAIRRLWSTVEPGGILILNYPNRGYLSALPPRPQDERWAIVERPMRERMNLLSQKRICDSIPKAKWKVMHRSGRGIVYLCAERVR